jgi:hypothetical protein
MSSINNGSVKKSLTKLNSKIKNPSGFLNDYGNGLKKGIRDRTQNKSKDYHGVNFASYTPAAKLMRKAAGFGSSRVDLVQTGRMLGSIMSKMSKKNELTLYFSDSFSLRKAMKHQTGDGVKKREFFGLDKEQKKHLKADLMDYLVKHFK